MLPNFKCETDMQNLLSFLHNELYDILERIEKMKNEKRHQPDTLYFLLYCCAKEAMIEQKISWFHFIETKFQMTTYL